MASGPITSWQTDGKTVKIVADLILGGSKITADGDCSNEIQRCFTPWKESYDQPRQHTEKQRHYFVNKGPPSQGYGCEKLDYKAERRRIDAFELWGQRRLLRVLRLESPLDCKEIQPVHPKGDQS